MFQLTKFTREIKEAQLVVALTLMKCQAIGQIQVRELLVVKMDAKTDI